MAIAKVAAVFLLCLGVAASQALGQVRLAGETTFRGRLEVFLDGAWGTVCINNFTQGAAQAACRQLGSSTISQFDTVEALGIPKAANSTSIVLESVNCPYSSFASNGLLHILRCSYTRQISANCSHDSDVALQCSSTRVDFSPYDSAVRLVSSDNTNQWTQASGILEVYLKGQWGTVCSEQVVPTVADSACRQLGYTNASGATGSSTALGVPIWVRDLDCGISGSQPCLVQCYTYPSNPVSGCPRNLVTHLECTFDISHNFSNTAGSDALCTGYIIISSAVIAIVVGVIVASFVVCLCAILLPIFICCCCVSSSALYQLRTRRKTYYEIY